MELPDLFRLYLGLPSKKPMMLEIERAEGIYLFGPGGKRYFDLVSGVSVCNTGHRHPEVIEAIRLQMDAYLHVMVYGEFVQSPQVRFAELLAKQLPGSLSSVYFVNSGSEAIEGAMKLAKRVTGRTGMISFRNAYHGSTQGALSILGDEHWKTSFRPLIPDTMLIRFNHKDDLQCITERTACVVAEVVQAEAGVILPEDGYLQALALRCIETGTLLVLDEVQTGFGRCGSLFAFEKYGIIPDILVIAKGMGGGMPLGAFIASREIMDALTFNPELGHITTFGGHPVSCAAGLANLQVILHDRLALGAEQKGKIFFDLLSGHPAIKEIRFSGLMLGVELESAAMTSKLWSLLTEHGVIIDWYLFSPTTFRISPPLTISAAEISEACSIINRCLDQLIK
ncbi:MAG: aspartate aminotransferase family protein [Bacteroidetes bacterium]|nr:aspartate aminotransferase family protein [Bacteroidota bacterium]